MLIRETNFNYISHIHKHIVLRIIIVIRNGNVQFFNQLRQQNLAVALDGVIHTVIMEIHRIGNTERRETVGCKDDISVLISAAQVNQFLTNLVEHMDVGNVFAFFSRFGQFNGKWQGNLSLYFMQIPQADVEPLSLYFFHILPLAESSDQGVRNIGFTTHIHR